ncbi:hypothetical protein [Sphingomonas sp. Leaf230]|uniref:hypothetical protein n=1 Tax=Sphingomonas sp. Leaf230 TaxID=1735694 RepID=UPI0006F36BC3|nr:hypothetical protein [Sphingomonas sp. Leaf230]
MPSLADFLRRNSVEASTTLPLVQSVSAYRLIKSIRPNDSIDAVDCDVFAGEKLNYFFVGRPAYKSESSDAQAADWELPCCFIFEYASIKGIKRVFPFDSGAHHGKRYPNYISMMDLSEFDTGDVIDAPARIIGAYFGSAKAYFNLKPKAEDAFVEEFSLGPLDAEIMAVHRLAGDNRDADQFDDRRLTIEVQSDQHVDLTVAKPLAVILPAVYLDSVEVREAIETRWGAEAITYSISSLSLKHYYGTIYQKVLDFYQSRGWL